MKTAVMKFMDESTGKTSNRICAVNNSGMGGEYTVCGCAMPDSTLKFERFELVRYGEGKPTCLECISIIKWFKELK